MIIPTGNTTMILPVKGSEGIVENQFVIDISNNIPAQILVISFVILLIFIVVRLLMKLEFFEEL